MSTGPARSGLGPAGRAANRTIRAFVETGVLDRARDAAAIDRLKNLAALVDNAKPRQETVSCPECDAQVSFDVGVDDASVVRVSRELRAWWQAIRERREAVNQGVSLDSIFADLDADLRTDAPQ